MQGPPFKKEIHLPYSKWSQHRAKNGLIYLAHPITGEVKWLWSRHHDPNTEHDYLVNTITGKREWVTKENAHFCPVSPQTNSKISASSKTPAESNDTNNKTPNSPLAAAKAASSNSRPNSSAAERLAEMPTPPAKIASAPEKGSTINIKSKYREIPAPKSLGLTADEVLMLVPDTGRRYIFNKKTKTSRWLPDRAPATLNEKQQKPRFGRSRAPKQTLPPLSDDDDLHPELRKKTEVLSLGTEYNAHPSENGIQQVPLTSDSVTQTYDEQIESSAGENAHAGQHLNGQSDANRTTHSASESEDEVDEISVRLRALNTILVDVTKLTTSDKYNMSNLRSLSKGGLSKEEAQAGSQRLLELEEYLTQQMLKVDAVESEGNQLIRAKRKETVKAILALTEEIERLREELSC